MNTKRYPSFCRAWLLLLPVTAATAAPVLEEVVVTAQKRAENQQEVPVAISAFTAATLEQKGITTTDDLSIVTPGLQAGRQTSSSTPYLRGVGTQSAAAGDESSIAMYVDGVYSPSTRSNTMSFNNVERIEVLKGPQGTLFGRNATGGLIHVITKDPSTEFGGKLEGAIGNYNTVGSKLYITGPLSDTLAADLAVLYEDQDKGWGENRVTGNDVNLASTTALRSKFLLMPSDKTEIKLGLNYTDSEGDIGMARQVAPGALGADGLLYYQGCLAGPNPDPATCGAFAAQNASRYTGDWYDVATEKDVFSNAEDSGVSLHVSHSFEHFELLSISAWQDNDIEQFMDVDASALLFQSADLSYTTETVTQEFQLTSTNDGPFNWILGFFYMDSTADYAPFELYVVGMPSPFLTSTNSQDTTSYSVFFQGDYLLTEATKLTLGLRATKDERTLDADLTFYNADGSMMPVGYYTVTDELDEDWVEPTWRVSLDHQLNDDMLLFASVSRGFKSGVYNLAGFPADPVDPETLDAYEVGFKSDLLASSLRLNGSVFLYDYKDVQLQRVEQGSAFLVNAAAAEIYGLELDALWLVSEALTLTAGLSVTESEYTDYPNGTVNTPTGIGGNAQSSADLSGNNVIRTPDFTVNLGVSYAWQMAAGEVVASANYYYNDGYFWEPENRHEQPSYELVNADLSFTTADEEWKFKFFVKNLMDEEYSYYGNSSAAGDAVSAAPPRTFGVAAEYRF